MFCDSARELFLNMDHLMVHKDERMTGVEVWRRVGVTINTCRRCWRELVPGDENPRSRDHSGLTGGSEARRGRTALSTELAGLTFKDVSPGDREVRPLRLWR